jgi:hypothetical protein
MERKRRRWRIAARWLPWLLAATLGAAAQAADLRAFNTDRPDTTEGPFTVDAGHFQLELSFAEWTRDHDGGSTRDAWSVLPFNLRWGATPSHELDAILEPYGSERTRAGGRTVDRTSGFGDLTLRGKWNLWGDDGGPSAFALLPYVTLPTAASGRDSGRVEGGLVLPLAFALPGDWDLATMLDVSVERNQANDGYAADLVHSASLGHDLVEGVGAYVELAGFWSPSGDQPYRATFDTGVTWARGPNAQLDAGVRVGLTRATEDFAVFAGYGVRF